jgi:hypothetical protein
MATSDSSHEELVPPVPPGSIEPHFERFISTDGDVILIECECPIGREHTYGEWLTRFTRDGA